MTADPDADLSPADREVAERLEQAMAEEARVTQRALATVRRAQGAPK